MPVGMAAPWLQGSTWFIWAWMGRS